MTNEHDIAKPNICHLSYGEEEWIDWLLGHIPTERRAMMGAHAHTCPACREIIAYWRPLLAAPSDVAVPDRQVVQQTRELTAHPSYRKLKQTVQHIGNRKRSVRRWKRISQGTAALVFVAFMAWSLSGLYKHNAADHGGGHSQYVAHYEPGAVPFFHDPTTASYRVASEFGESRDSYIWFNDRSGEMLVLVDGLLPSNGYAIQAWAVHNNDHVNLGLLRQSELRRAHLYIKGMQLIDLENVALTIEPDGGSLTPTTPDIMLIRLKQK